MTISSVMQTQCTVKSYKVKKSTQQKDSEEKKTHELPTDNHVVIPETMLFPPGNLCLLCCQYLDCSILKVID